MAVGGRERLRGHLVHCSPICKRHNFNLFVVYRIAVAVAMLVIIAIGWRAASGI